MVERQERRIPSPGPRPYGDDLADCFYGRKPEIAMIMDRVHGQRLSVLVAESASGKTSLLQAGVIPELRMLRLRGRAAGGGLLPQFPLLLNQWLGRASGARRTEFVRLLATEIDRYLESCVEWYRRGRAGDDTLMAAAECEIASITKARAAVQQTAVQLQLGAVDAATGQLLPLETDGQARDDDRKMARNVYALVSALAGALENVLLVLDQFEEVLGDPVIGRQATIAVETIFENCRDNVRQFISMRNDSIHLLDPLEKQSILEGKRRVSITKLAAPAVNTIVAEMSKFAQLTWTDPADRERLVGTFTTQRPPRDVNLLGLQVVLADLFGSLIARGATEIGIDDIRAYCRDSLGMPPGALDVWLDAHPDPDNPAEMRNGELAEIAPRKWIDRCLDGSVAGSHAAAALGAAIWPGQIKPMIMRMADWLVTPSGLKRPMTLGELEKMAFRDDLEKRSVAGSAKEWSGPRLEAVLERTCKTALARLVDGHVLKERGGTSEKTYELVHDQFGRPLRQWAALFSQSPAADLASPFEIADRPFDWHGPLRGSLADGRMEDIAWVGCKVNRVDFSGVTIVNCDFRRTAFERCTFDADTVLKNCTFEGALFEGCTFTGTTFESCDLDVIRIATSTLENVTITGENMRSATVAECRVRQLRFAGIAEKPLTMRNFELLDCKLEERVTFELCSLDGATIGTDADAAPGRVIPAGDMTFIDCDLAGAEFSNLSFERGRLELHGGAARGAVFTRIITGKAAATGGCLFDAVALTGAVFLACELRSSEFRGTEVPVGNTQMTEASTVVFRQLGSDDDSSPTILDDVLFRNLDMENFSIDGCSIEGPIVFDNCRASGGTIRGSKTNASQRVRGSITFRGGCDLAALELNALDLTGETLNIDGCKAPGIYFEKVTLAGRGARWSARFLQTDMPGALFLDCHIEHASFSGSDEKKSALDSLVIRGTEDGASTIANCQFDRVSMESFTIENSTVAGEIEFRNSILAGGTIGNSNVEGEVERKPMRVNATLRFEESDLRAFEVANVTFAPGAQLISTRCDCRGAYFGDSTFQHDGTSTAPPLLIDDVDLSGCVFVGCVLPKAAFVGRGDTRLTPALGIVFRNNEVGEIAFRDYDCDGASFEGVSVSAGMFFEECSLLRSRFARIHVSGDRAMCDVRRSDVLYAEIEDALLESAASSRPALAMLPEQLDASKAAAAIRKNLRFADRKS